MGWILLGILVVLGLPFVLMAMGIAVALWAVMGVLALVWGVVAFVFGSPVLALLLALAIGILIGRGAAPRRA